MGSPTSPLQECSHAARITDALPCPSCPAEVRTSLLRFVGCRFPCLVLHHCTYSFLPRAFLQGFSRLPGTAVGLFNMAQEGEWLQNRAENWSQAVISFHRCPPVTFSAEPHLLLFPPLRLGICQSSMGKVSCGQILQILHHCKCGFLGCLHTLL